MTHPLAVEIAATIAEKLFTSGNGEKANRLTMRLYTDDFQVRDLGGWNRDSAIAQIASVLAAHLPAATERPHFACLTCGPTAVDEDGYSIAPISLTPPTTPDEGPDIEAWVQMDDRLGLVRTQVLAALGPDVLGALDDAVLAMLRRMGEGETGKSADVLRKLRHPLEARLMEIWHPHDLAWKARYMLKYPDGLDPIIAILRASRSAPGERVTPELVHGYDATFWHESYTMLRDAVTTHLDDCIRDDDVAEESILVEAIETAGQRLKAAQPSAPAETAE